MRKADKATRVRAPVDHLTTPARTDTPLMREVLKITLMLGIGIALSVVAHTL